METGLEQFLRFTDGLMIIPNRVRKKILFPKSFL